MIITKIQKKNSGNCGCFNCGKVQEGSKYHPITLWHKDEDEKRGHQLPMCSIECAEEYAMKLKEML